MLLLLVALGFAGDIDGDAIDDAVDNCVFYANADQADGNNDGYGDACADPSATVGSDVVIARNVTVSAGAVIGDGVVLLPHAYIGVDAVVGDGAVIRGRLDDSGAAGPARVMSQGTVARRGSVASGGVVGVRAAVWGELGTGARVGEDAVLARRGVLGPLVEVGQRSVVRGIVGVQSVLGNDVSTGGRSQLGARVTVHDDVRIARHVLIGDDTVIGSGTVVWAFSEIGERGRLGENVRVRGRSVLGEDISMGDAAVVRRETRLPSGTSVVGGTISDGQDLQTDDNESCVDGVDNDLDSAVDCLDSDCATHFACSVETHCSDGVDNDYDGAVDCQDRDCSGQDSCPGEADCADGIDNDSSGAADCSDPTCFGRPGCTVETLCNDGLDNDADGYRDDSPSSLPYGDLDCRAPSQRCSGIRFDGDADGLPASVDPDCRAPGVTELCNNGVDDDGNGFLDCEDAACSSASMCVEDCVDGLDNDLDGDVDCADSDCLAEVCLAERRVAGGRVFLERGRDLDSTFSDADGGGCTDSVSLNQMSMNSAEIEIDADSVEVRLRVPTTMGAFSSSTCVVSLGVLGGADADLYQSGQTVGISPPLASLLVHDQRQQAAWGGGVSEDCNWTAEASRAAVFHPENAARFLLDVGEQPVVFSGLGAWQVGTPSYWVGESLVESEVFQPRRPENCVSVRVSKRELYDASWSLPSQTHTFLPPEP